MVANMFCKRRRPQYIDCFIFDDMWSILHAILGLIVAILSKYMPVLALIVALAFFVYEVMEDRYCNTYGKAKCDIVEFAVGYIIGTILSYII